MLRAVPRARSHGDGERGEQGYKGESGDKRSEKCDKRTYHNAIAMLGLIMQRVHNDIEKASILYSTVLHSDPDHVLTLDHKCSLLTQQGQRDEAMKLHKRVCSLDPTHTKKVRESPRPARKLLRLAVRARQRSRVGTRRRNVRTVRDPELCVPGELVPQVVGPAARTDDHAGWFSRPPSEARCRERACRRGLSAGVARLRTSLYNLRTCFRLGRGGRHGRRIRGGA
jgi:hypothetical protein